MKIAIIGANGKQGKLLVREAISRGHEVTAIVRDTSKIKENVKILQKDLFQLTIDDLKNQDVIIDAFGTWSSETLIQHKTSLNHLCKILSNNSPRLLVVGGAGSLYVNPEHTVRVMDTPDFPESFKPLASNMGEALDALRKCSTVRWTYLSPAANFVSDGPRTGKYILAGEELKLNSKGDSQISYSDYAIAMIDEAENARYIGKRISVISE